MMLLHLIKKDVLIAKTLTLITLLVIIVIPLFIGRVAPTIPSLIPFFYMVILSVVMLLQAISQLEAKSPKAPALLCAAPYTRNALVKAKYIFFILLFTYCYIVHTLIALITNPSSMLDLTSILTVMLCSIVVHGIYMPIEFKYGAIKAKFIFMTLILLLSLGPPLYTEFFSGFITIDFTKLANIPLSVINIILALASITIFSISLMTSIKIYAKKEL